MQKYNQGFGWFGPMEKCDSGKWALAEEAEREIARINTELDERAEAYYLEIARINTERDEWFDAYYKSLDMISDGHFKVACLGVLTTIGWGIIAVALGKYAFTGHIL